MVMTAEQLNTEAVSLDGVSKQLAEMSARFKQLAVPAPPPVVTPPSLPIDSRFQQIYEENFEKNCGEDKFLEVYGDKLGAYPTTYRDTSKKGQYNPGIISVTDGVMNMRMHTNSAGVPQVAAPMPKIKQLDDWNQLYGRYEVRFQADAVPRYKTAFLLWPKSEKWPRDGEIDFPEGELNGTISAFMHRQGATAGSDQDHYGSSARYDTWHTAVVEWMPGRCAFFLDGVTLGIATARVPNTPMRWVLQAETSLTSAYPAKATTANVKIDRIAVWKYAA